MDSERLFQIKLRKEADAEAHIYGETEKFVTSAYKEKLEEMKRWKDEDQRLQALEDSTTVEAAQDMTGLQKPADEEPRHGQRRRGEARDLGLHRRVEAQRHRVLEGKESGVGRGEAEEEAAEESTEDMRRRCCGERRRASRAETSGKRKRRQRGRDADVDEETNNNNNGGAAPAAVDLAAAAAAAAAKEEEEAKAERKTTCPRRSGTWRKKRRAVGRSSGSSKRQQGPAVCGPRVARASSEQQGKVKGRELRGPSGERGPQRGARARG